MKKLTLVSINIEMARRLDLVAAFLELEKPDVVCMQEVFEQDLQDFAKKLGMESVFAQMSLAGRIEETEGPYFPFGIGMLSGLPVRNIHRRYYQGNEESARTNVTNDNSREDGHVFLHGGVEKGNTRFSIGTTHFIWTPNGEADDLQRKNLERLLAILQNIPEIVFCGDFNAPRGRETFDTIAARYKDNIPPHYTTSIDVNLHRLGDKLRGEPLMVDGLFTTREYEAQNVRLQDGVSDHMAIVAEISRG